MTQKVRIRRLPTGVQGLDEVLGGGLPEFSFNLIAGGPGCGKTTLSHQFVFANANDAAKALYFTVFGEPPIKMLRYQQQLSFFDATKINRSIRFVHLGKDMLEGGLSRVLERITNELEADDARIVVVDSFRSVVRSAPVASEGELGLERFVQLLALTLTSYEATTFLVGEYLEQETHSNPIFTVADGILWLYQTVVRNSAVRSLQVVKMRGQAQSPGLHTVRLTDAGMRVFPRLQSVEEPPVRARKTAPRINKTGVPGLDEMLGGGIAAGYSVMVAGPSGSGKSVLSTQFILEGAKNGEAGVIAIFDKRPEDYLGSSSQREQLELLITKGKLKLIYIRALDLSVDETLDELQEEVRRLGATRVVIDSIPGFELALAPTFRDDFRESLYRMIGALKRLGVTVMATVEVGDSILSPKGISFLTDGIILQRYMERDGRLGRVMTVLKMRACSHSKELREYDITDEGLVVGKALVAYHGVLTGVPVPTEQRRAAREPGTLGAQRRRAKRAGRNRR